MYLKSLTLKGFKSFASATTLKFEPGICAVVGPNGSGKSNVVDALAWVMGEQGAKTLRGGKMQDVIFAGAGDRKPLGRAEVTLSIDNSDGALPIEYSEVSITRRMFRDGASEYEINGSRARLMDVQELLSDSGIGREMHVIVGQGRLSQILESRPEERRAFIEEAAGVLKHRRRKEKAQRKLVGMQANLDRLRDLTEELKKQLKPLARQAEAAKRAASVQAELREARLELAGYQLAQLETKLHRDDAQRKVVEEKLAEITAQLEEATGAQLEAEEELAQATPAAEKAQKLWFELSALLERVSATTRIATDRAASFTESAYQGPDPEELARRAERADAEYAELEEQAEITRTRLESIQEEVAELRERAEEADREHLAQVRAIADRREGVVRLLAAEESQAAQVAAAQAEAARHEEQLTETRQRVRLAGEELENLQRELAEAQEKAAPFGQARTQALAESEAAEARLEQLRDGQRRLEKEVSRLESRIETLKATAPRGQDAVADLERVAGKLRLNEAGRAAEASVALAAALGPMAEALAADADRLAQLWEAELSRTYLLLPGEPTEGWRLDATLEEGCAWILDLIDIDSDIARPITRLLAEYVLAPDNAVAQRLVAEDPRLKAVTPDGAVFGEGFVALGRGPGSSVEVAGLIAEAGEELEVTRAQLEELAGTFEGARESAEEARVRAASATASHREQLVLISGLEKDCARLEQQLKANESEHQRVASRTQAAEIRIAELKKQHEETKDRLARVSGEEDLEEPSTAERDEAQAALAQITAMEMEAKLSLRTAEERVNQQRGRGEALRRQAEHERQAKARHERAQQQRRAQAELAAVVAESARDLSARVGDALERASAERDRTAAEKQRTQARVETTKDAARALQTQLGRLSDSAHAAEIASEQARVRLEETAAKLQEQLGVPWQELAQDYARGEDFDATAARERLARAEKDLNALGKVNPLALEEYAALQDRYEFLATQLADVEQARKDLGEVIEDVDKRILQLFTDAWHDVEAQFPKVFATLFPGGEGRLVLTDPQDMLATGIEVEARPPGKKVKRLSLLSGGEKSLTALAMLVAIFKARPSPFYVMDEVEAALDDVNLRRLIALFEELRKDSQLIVITHQKPTMDIANVLYGVTMRGDGITRVISQRMQPAES